MNIIKSFRSLVLYLFILLPVAMSCSQQARDKAIKADITSKAKEDVNFAGIQFTVNNGIVTLTGICATDEAKALVKQKLKSIHVVDSVDDQLKVGPVLINANFSLQRKVDSVLSTYPTVYAHVTDTLILLSGNLEEKELKTLMASIGSLDPRPALTSKKFYIH